MIVRCGREIGGVDFDDRCGRGSEEREGVGIRVETKFGAEDRVGICEIVEGGLEEGEIWGFREEESKDGDASAAEYGFAPAVLGAADKAVDVRLHRGGIETEVVSFRHDEKRIKKARRFRVVMDDGSDAYIGRKLGLAQRKDKKEKKENFCVFQFV